MCIRTIEELEQDTRENDKNEKKIVKKTEKMFYLCKDYINSL